MVGQTLRVIGLCYHALSWPVRAYRRWYREEVRRMRHRLGEDVRRLGGTVQWGDER